MKKVIAGVRDWWGRRHGEVEPEVEPDGQIVVGREQIRKILPHQGRMLLLDQVVISPTLVRGEFLVTKEVCEGHGVLGGQSVLRGVDIEDMAAQLLGVWASRFFPGSLAVVREYGGAKFMHPVRPGDLLEVEIPANCLQGEIVIRGSRKISRVWGRDFVARVGDRRCAAIAAVELAVLTPEEENE